MCGNESAAARGCEVTTRHPKGHAMRTWQRAYPGVGVGIIFEMADGFAAAFSSTVR